MAYEGLKKMMCGACGNEDFEIYEKQTAMTGLIVECKKCKSVTDVSVRHHDPELDLRFGDNSDGILCTK